MQSAPPTSIEQKEPDWGAPPQPPKKPGIKKGWIIAIVAGIVLMCLLSGACLFSCGLLFSKGKEEGAKQMTEVLRSAVQKHPRALEYRNDIQTLRQLIEDGELDLLAFGALSSELQLAQKDGEITTIEVTRLMGLVRTINRNKGSINKEALRPPGGAGTEE